MERDDRPRPDPAPWRAVGGQGRAGSASDDTPPADAETAGDLPPVPEPAPVRRATRAGRTLRGLRVLAPWLVVASIAFVAFTQADEVAEAASLLPHVAASLVALAVACQVAQYTALALHIRHLAGQPSNARRVGPFRTALVVFGLGPLLPAAPVEGLAMAGARMRRRGVARERVALILGLSQYFNIAVLYLFASITALVYTAVLGLPFAHNRLVLVAAGATLGFVGTTTFIATRASTIRWAAVALDRLRWWRRPRPTRADSRRRGDAWYAAAAHVVNGRRGFAVLFTTMAAAWIADATCFNAALRAVGIDLSAPELFFTYSVAMGLPRVWLTHRLPGVVGRGGCRHAQEVPAGVQA
jgi:Lysylphosphatidylglycerol synthase TM region